MEATHYYSDWMTAANSKRYRIHCTSREKGYSTVVEAEEKTGEEGRAVAKFMGIYSNPDEESFWTFRGGYTVAVALLEEALLSEGWDPESGDNGFGYSDPAYFLSVIC